MQKPDARGYFEGGFGGAFVPEVLVQALAELEAGLAAAVADASFWCEYEALLRDFVGRPSPILEARPGGDGAATIVFKREDLNHTGAHKINNAVGQGLLRAAAWASGASLRRPAPANTASRPRRSARSSVIPVDIYMGALDVERQVVERLRDEAARRERACRRTAARGR